MRFDQTAAALKRPHHAADIAGSLKRYLMHRLVWLSIAGFLLLDANRATTAAQDWQWAVASDLTEQRVIGLLNLPAMIGDGCGRTPFPHSNLYDTPSNSRPSKTILTLTVLHPLDAGCHKLTVREPTGRLEQLPTEESGYEIPAAIVYERAGSWYRIALKRGSAWMTHRSNADFLPYPELLLGDRLTYIRAGWDGRLWQSPGTGTPTRIPALTQNDDAIPIDALSIRRVRQQFWIQVRMSSHCDEDRADDDKAITGWIPAHRADNRPAAWFYARGC